MAKSDYYALNYITAAGKSRFNSGINPNAQASYFTVGFKVSFSETSGEK